MIYPHLDLFAAVRTVFKLLIQRFVTIGTEFVLMAGLPRKFRFKFGDRFLTAITHNEWFTFLDSQHRNKKQTEIVIHPFEMGLMQTTNRAASWVLVQHLGFGGYTGDENHKGHFIGL